MKNFALLLVAIVVFACNNTSPKNEEVKKTEVKTEIATLNSDDLLTKISEYVNKEVAVKGTVVHVCKHGGKKLHLVGQNPDERLIVFATEEIGKFERELEGSDVVLKGIVREERLDEKYLEEWLAKATENHKDDEDKDDFHKEQEDIESMRAKIKASEKGYISKYRMEAKTMNTKEVKK